ASGVGKHLRVNEARIERGVDTGDVRAYQKFKPAFGLRAIERVSRVARQRAAMSFQALQQLHQFRVRDGRELPAGVPEPKKNAAIFPVRHGKTAKAQPHFAFGDVWMHTDGPRRDSNERIESGERAVQKHLSLAV